MTASIRTPAGQRHRQRRAFEALPFVSAREPGAGFDYWSVESSGSYTEDCERGRDYAARFLDLDATYGNVSLLSCIAVSMMEKGPAARGIAIGFMAAIGRAAFAGKAIERVLKARDDQSGEALLALGDDFRAAWAHERHVFATTPSDDDESLLTAHEAASVIAKRIVVMRAATPAGMRVKAMVAGWAEGRRFDQLCGGESPWIGNIAIQSLLDDLGVVPPDPMPAVSAASANEGRVAA